MNKQYNIFKIAVLLLGIHVSHNTMAQQSETLTLNKAIEVTLQNNNLLNIKKLQASEQEAKIKEAKIRNSPVVMLNSAYQYNVNVGQLTIPGGSFGELPMGGAVIPLPATDESFELGEHHTFNAGVSVYQPITQLGKIKTGVDIAKTDFSITSLEQSKATLQITYAVEQLYYGILAVRKRMEEAQKNIEIAELNLYDLQSALLAGKTIDVNEVGLRALIADEEQELLMLKFQEEDYVAEFKQVTGITSEEIVLAYEDLNIDLGKSLYEYQEDANLNNVDLEITKLQKQKSDLGIKAAQQSNLPEIGLIGGYTYQQGNVIFPTNNPFIGANFRWNIQDLFINKQTLNQRKYIQQQAAENEIYVQKQLLVSVEKAYRKMKQAEELIGVAQKAVSYRKAELKIELDRKETGLGKPINVLEIESALAKSEADLYGAVMSYKVAKAELALLTNSK
ncbi:outer membrane protein TolC [Algoriphagus sp. 4150]|uniref:TolC family protein n=1 Tax=Algoriphagus sp. 4150 TaxID=2817756 RepID=UPI0028615F9D|nr:TolC family protein [Algoriphagus sp. 4150]MDR7132454.1 outer membrane protein TolC [Algoriphagus sp. 4150]